MMIEEHDANTAQSGRARHWCGTSRNSGIFWGIVILALGVIWIGKVTGVIPLDMTLFWPSIMVIAGAWLLIWAIARKLKST